MEPYLKYPGSKKWIGSWLNEKQIIEKIRKHNIPVYSPFCGALGDLLLIQPQQVIANDIFYSLINLHMHVQQPNFKIDIPFRYSEYNENREYFNRELIHPIVDDPYKSAIAAQYFYYLMRVGFNGINRTNKDGDWNVPRGMPSSEMDWRSHRLDIDFSPYQKITQNWKFTCGDFSEVKLSGQELIIADPPYHCTFSYTSAFSLDDQTRLVSWLISSNCPFILFNSDTAEIEELYKKKNLIIEKVTRTRTVSQNSRKRVTEIIARNFD